MVPGQMLVRSLLKPRNYPRQLLTNTNAENSKISRPLNSGSAPPCSYRALRTRCFLGSSRRKFTASNKPSSSLSSSITPQPPSSGPQLEPSTTTKPPHTHLSSPRFLDVWRDKVARGKLRPDKAQERAAKRLHRLQQALLEYRYTNELHEQDEGNASQQQQTSSLDDKVPVNSASSTTQHNKEIMYDGNPTFRPKAENILGYIEFKESPSTQPKNADATPAAQNHYPEPAKELDNPVPPRRRVLRGLYLYGPVGTGKTLLMDTFYHCAFVHDDKKHRTHFHAFLANVHQQIHALKQDDLMAHGRNFSVDTSTQHNPIVRVATQWAQQTTLLCLDEFQVTDVADALILSQFFKVLWDHGTVVVATSNRPPQDLYEGGLNRSYFLPFIDLLHRYCVVHALDSDCDYRKVMAATTTTRKYKVEFAWPHDKFFVSQNQVDVDDLFRDDHDNHHLQQLPPLAYFHPDRRLPELTKVELPAGFGRTLTCTTVDRDGFVGRFTFSDLCDRDLGASDYRALAQHCSIVVLESIPYLSTRDHNRARRFITLVDELYEAQCAVLCSTVPNLNSPDELFRISQGDTDATGTSSDDDMDIDVSNSLGLEDVQTQGGQPVSTLASVRELSFAFRRAASRLTEMTSRGWWHQQLL